MAGAQQQVCRLRPGKADVGERLDDRGEVTSGIRELFRDNSREFGQVKPGSSPDGRDLAERPAMQARSQSRSRTSSRLLAGES